MASRKFVFEKAMGRAEEIAAAIEQGEIGLEESLKQFEEGMGLIHRCRKVLDEAEHKIQCLEAAGPNGVSVHEMPDGESSTSSDPTG